MTNLQWVASRKLTEIVADIIDTALDNYTEENMEKLYAYQWLFKEREEIENVQLPSNPPNE